MDRFVVGDPIPKEVEALHAVSHIGSNLFWISSRGMQSEHGRHCGDPQRGQVRGLTQIAPESEVQLGDNPVMQFCTPASTGCALSGNRDVLTGPPRVAAWEELSSPVPRALPPLRFAVPPKRLVDRVAKDDLQTTKISM